MLKDPPLLTIRRRFPRLDAATLAAFRGVQTGHLVDAMAGRGALDFAIKPVDPARAAFVGSALPCETGPSDNLAILAAISIAEPGDVVVAASDAFTGTAVIGDNVSALARNRGVAALVTDGLVRDTPGIIGVELPVFARGVTPNSCMRSGPGRVGLPVVAGGVRVEAGDLVAGDRDGVVVVPRAEVATVLARLAEIRGAEAAVQAKLGAGITSLEHIEAILQSERTVYID